MVTTNDVFQKVGTDRFTPCLLDLCKVLHSLNNALRKGYLTPTKDNFKSQEITSTVKYLFKRFTKKAFVSETKKFQNRLYLFSTSLAPLFGIIVTSNDFPIAVILTTPRKFRR